MKIRKAIFPLGGSGSRLFPMTKAIPKEMLPVLDKPLLHYSVKEALESGITNLIFVVSNQKNILKKYFNTNLSKIKNSHTNEYDSLISKIKSITYIKQKKPLGLGHAIWCTKDVIGNEPFAILLPDDLIKAKTHTLKLMIQYFKKLNSPIMAISKIKNKDSGNYGILNKFSSQTKRIVKVFSIIEKPLPNKTSSNLAIVGRYILTPDIFDCLKKTKKGHGNEIQLTDSIIKLLKLKSIYGYQYEGIRFDCGSKAGLQMANIAFAINKSEIKKQMMSFLNEN